MKTMNTKRESIQILYPEMRMYGIKRYGKEYGEDAVHNAAVVLLESKLHYIDQDKTRALWVAAIHKAYNTVRYPKNDISELNTTNLDGANFIVQEETPLQHARRVFLEGKGSLGTLASKLIWERHFLGHDWREIRFRNNLSKQECYKIYSRAVGKLQSLFNAIEK